MKNSKQQTIVKALLTVLYKKIYHLGTASVHLSVSAIARCFPIRKNTIVFSSYPDFSDNSWAVYKYLKGNRPDLELFWIMSGQHKPEEVNDKEILKNNIWNYFFYYWTICRAGYIMATHSCFGDRFNRKRKTIIYLNHGGCPIKAEKRERQETRSQRTYNYALCRGKDAVIPASKWLCCDQKFVLPLGMARDDIFCKNIGPGNKNPFYDGLSLKLILWMPTFRKSINPELSENHSATPTGLPLMQSEEDLFTLDRFLKYNNIQLLIKIHPLQEDNSVFKKHFSNITIIANTNLNKINKQTYEVIGYSDALITDYSSVYFDYLIADKPIGFILDDYDRYVEDRGFAIDNPKEIMAGHQIYNVNQLEFFFKDIIDNKDKYKGKRQLMKERFVGENPELTSKRIVEYFKI